MIWEWILGWWFVGHCQSFILRGECLDGDQIWGINSNNNKMDKQSSFCNENSMRPYRRECYKARCFVSLGSNNTVNMNESLMRAPNDWMTSIGLSHREQNRVDWYQVQVFISLVCILCSMNLALNLSSDRRSDTGEWNSDFALRLSCHANAWCDLFLSRHSSCRMWSLNGICTNDRKGPKFHGGSLIFRAYTFVKKSK